MHFKRLLFSILCIGIFFLILSTPYIAFSGVTNGLKLWTFTLIPALFPSILLITILLNVIDMPPFLAYLYILLSGLLSGFPMGAYLCGEYHKSHPNETVCNELAAFCNISSPSFVCNYIICQILPSDSSLLTALLCIYLPVLECIALVCLLNFKQFHQSGQSYTSVTDKVTQQNSLSLSQFALLIDSSILKTITTLLKLGGYIIIFSCITAYIQHVWTNPLYAAILCCFTEITTGLQCAKSIPLPLTLQFFLIICTNAWGGISTLLQTAGITHGCGISIKKYTCNKLLLTLITFVNAWFITCIL